MFNCQEFGFKLVASVSGHGNFYVVPKTIPVRKKKSRAINPTQAKFLTKSWAHLSQVYV